MVVVGVEEAIAPPLADWTLNAAAVAAVVQGHRAVEKVTVVVVVLEDNTGEVQKAVGHCETVVVVGWDAVDTED